MGSYAAVLIRPRPPGPALGPRPQARAGGSPRAQRAPWGPAARAAGPPGPPKVRHTIAISEVPEFARVTLRAQLPPGMSIEEAKRLVLLAGPALVLSRLERGPDASGPSSPEPVVSQPYPLMASRLGDRVPVAVGLTFTMRPPLRDALLAGGNPLRPTSVRLPAPWPADAPPATIHDGRLLDEQEAYLSGVPAEVPTAAFIAHFRAAYPCVTSMARIHLDCGMASDRFSLVIRRSDDTLPREVELLVAGQPGTAVVWRRSLFPTEPAPPAGQPPAAAAAAAAGAAATGAPPAGAPSRAAWLRCPPPRSPTRSCWWLWLALSVLAGRLSLAPPPLCHVTLTHLQALSPWGRRAPLWCTPARGWTPPSLRIRHSPPPCTPPALAGAMAWAPGGARPASRPPTAPAPPPPLRAPACWRARMVCCVRALCTCAGALRCGRSAACASPLAPCRPLMTTLPLLPPSPAPATPLVRPATVCPCLLLGWWWPAPLLLRPLWQLWPPPLWRPRWLLRPLWLPGPGLPPLPKRLLPLRIIPSLNTAAAAASAGGPLARRPLLAGGKRGAVSDIRRSERLRRVSADAPDGVMTDAASC